MADHYIGCRDVKKTPRWGVFSLRPQRLCREEGSIEYPSAASHYIGCIVDFPDCRCLRCERDDCEYEQPCCLEHGHVCNSDHYCPDFIGEDDGKLRRIMRRLCRRLRGRGRRAGGDAPYEAETEGSEDV